MGIVIFLCIVISLVVLFFAALEFASIAEEKGYEGTKYFWYTFLLGIIGMLMVVALPDRNMSTNLSQNLEMKNVASNDAEDINSLVKNTNSSNQDNTKETIVDAKPNETENNVPVKAAIHDGQKVCPNCGKIQNYDRKKCWECGQLFAE